MNGFSLRPARSTDAGKVGAILSGFIDETDWMPRLHSRAQDVGFAGLMIDQGWITIAEQAGSICGFAAREGHNLHALYIDTDRRGIGCGTALVDHMKANTGQLDLWTFQANAPAQAFYKGRGFAEIKRTDGAGNDEQLPDIRFRWQAKGAQT